MNEMMQKTDEFGFSIWEDEDHIKWWDREKYITYEHILLGSKYEPKEHEIREELPFNFKLADDEVIWGYHYGGVLSGRWGYFITKKNRPFWIERSIMTKMS